MGAEILAPHSLFLSFFLLASSFFISPPPLSLFISFFPLIFLLHFIISSHKKHFSKLLNSPSSISINISLDLPVLSNFIPHPFSKTHFLCIKMASSSKGSSFLASHGKKYDPTFEWHNEHGLLQDPRSHAPYYHVDTMVSFSLVSLFGKMLLHVSLKVSW